MASLRPIDHNTQQQLNTHLMGVEQALDADALAIVSRIVFGLEGMVKRAIEAFPTKRPRLAVIIDTPGGIAEVVERMVTTIRHHYSEVYFVVPDRAMSAGTIFACSGDRIFMSYFSVLGPIDPQLEKEDGTLIPALSYLSQFHRLCQKADAGELNTAEYALLSKLDLGELHQFEQARELSIDLLENWLSQYKFRNWTVHSSTGAPVTEDEKRARAKEIGVALSNNERWHSHGRGISRDTLVKEMRLKIDKVEDVANLQPALDDYFALLKDYMGREQYRVFIHTKEYF